MSESKVENDKKIIVTGDVTIDWLQWDIKAKEENISKLSEDKAAESGENSQTADKEDHKILPPNWELYAGYHMIARHGGAKLLAQMVEHAVSTECILKEPEDIEDNQNSSDNEIQEYKDPTFAVIPQIMEEPLDCISPKKVIHSITMLGEYDDPWDDKASKDKIYRVKEFRGFCGPEDEFPKTRPIKDDDANAELVVIDDAGNGFRYEEETSWPLAIQKGKNPVVVLKMSRPLTKNPLWDRLNENHDEKLVVILSANDLRNHGANISQHLSWERTAQDLLWEIENNPKIIQFKGCKNLIVRFGIDGAILYQNQGESKAIFIYDPKVCEDGYRESQNGDMQGYGNAFTAAISACIAKNGLEEINRIVENGLISMRKLLKYGFGRVNSEPHYPIDKIFGGYAEDETFYSIEIPRNPNNDFWTILEDNTRWKLQSVAKSYILKGDASQLGSVPLGQFEGLQTVDRAEIESYQSIRNLMKEYMKKENPKAPLCIGVFGPPGSGKSFGVVQLANSIDKDKVEKIEFNVSQFESTHDLTNAFHRVRDLVLEGKIPLVFFDEFDSSFEDTKLGWLKYFLAPMNDGEFKYGESMHPIGKSIFVFAGGTSNNFQEFAREKEIDNRLNRAKKKEIEEDKKHFRSAKGTDFISRLRGHVNVMGPNRNEDKDTFYMIRRALFLRSMIERNAKQLINGKGEANIDETVLRALLKVPKYKHGVRSMEAIIAMSMLSDKKKFEQSALPPEEQLDMHVNAEIFSKLVARDVLLCSAMENLAKEIHEDYIERNKDKKSADDVTMKPWDELDENIKKERDILQSNREQAQQIPEKLQRVHYDFMPAINEPKKFKFSKDEIEILAEMEHERWMKERFAKGWKQDYDIEKSDHERKLSPYLIPWNELTKEVKDWDREPVSKIPEMLKKAGFEIYSLK